MVNQSRIEWLSKDNGFYKYRSINQLCKYIFYYFLFLLNCGTIASLKMYQPKYFDHETSTL